MSVSFPPSLLRARTVGALLAPLLLTLAGCGGGGGGGSIGGVGSNIPELAEEISYLGPTLSTARYSHTSTVLSNGDVLVVGGTDERHLTALSEVELFVEDALVPLGVNPPETIRGDFIDQTIDGDIMELPGGTGRFWHTATRLSANRVVVIGGTNSVLFGTPNSQSVIYDPTSRTFDEPSLLIDPMEDINIPRVRHTTTVLPSGDLLIVGGQFFDTVFVPPNGNQLAYASERDTELFDPGTLTFSFAVDTTGNAVQLTNVRGRSGHAAVPIGGFDGILGNGDDLVMITGGFETLSPGSLLAPENLLPWNDTTTKLTSVDFFSVQSQSMSFASGLALAPRVNNPVAINLGQERRQNPFGEPGMTNIVLLFGGDSDQQCPTGASASGGSTDLSDLVSVSYSGFGPGGGATFRRVPGSDIFNPVSGITSNTHDLGHELLMSDLAGTLGCVPFSRSGGAGVLLEIRRPYDNNRTASIIFVAGGIDVSNEPGLGCFETSGSFCGVNEIGGYMIFDPFWDPSRIGTVLPFTSGVGYDEDNLDATTENPTGTTGSWLALDALLPGPDETGYADGGSVSEVATTALRQARAFHTVDRIGGPNGTIGNSDDRVLIIGGSVGYLSGVGFGGAPVSNSCEIYVPPGAGL
ncbi:MAG: Kelch repeat-containing protein [Planctomycetota bacterium]